MEVKILEHLRHKDPDDVSGLVHMHEYFYFRNHLCISFELLSINLYEFIKNNNFQGLSLGLIRRFAQQLLVSLRFLRRQARLRPDSVAQPRPWVPSAAPFDLPPPTVLSQASYASCVVPP